MYVIKNGKILSGKRMTEVGNGQIAGPGGHVHIGETPKEAAIRETQEEFGITPKDLMYIGKNEKDAYGITPYVFICTEWDGKVKCPDHEMSEPRFRSVNSLLNKDLFDAFESGIDLVISTVFGNSHIDNDGRRDIVTLDNNAQFDASGQREHGEWITVNGTHCLIDKAGAIVYGPDELKGLPKSESTEEKQKPARIPKQKLKHIATAANKACTGFANDDSAKAHEKHWAEFGVSSREDYEQLAIDFLKQPVGGDIQGYARANGSFVRFNWETGEYAVGYPGSRVVTYYKAKYDEESGKSDIDAAREYYKRDQDRQGVEL